MIDFLKTNKLLVCLSFIIFFIMVFQGPWLQPDSPGYIGGDVSRSFLYPAFLKTIAFFAPENYTIVMIVQLLMGFSAIFYTLYKLTNWFGLNTLMRFSIFVVLLLPYVGHTKIGNTILTEPICYPLFMLFFINVFESYIKKNKACFFFGLLFAYLLMVTRKQFSFVFSVFYFVLFFEYMRDRIINFMKMALPILVFILGMVSEYSYVYYKTGKFSSIPFSITYVAAPLFIAHEGNIKDLKDENQKNFLKEALKIRDQKKLSIYHDKYEEFYFPPCMKYEVIHDYFRYNLTPNILSTMDLKGQNTDNFVKEISFDLIKMNFGQYIRIVRGNIINSIGGYYWFATLLFFFGYIPFQRQKDEYMFFLFIAVGLNLLNYFFVGLFQPIIRRYTFYTDTFLLISFMLFLKSYFLCKKPS